jgi:hypothetical protein
MNELSGAGTGDGSGRVAAMAQIVKVELGLHACTSRAVEGIDRLWAQLITTRLKAGRESDLRQLGDEIRNAEQPGSGAHELLL